MRIQLAVVLYLFSAACGPKSAPPPVTPPAQPTATPAVPVVDDDNDSDRVDPHEGHGEHQHPPSITLDALAGGALMLSGLGDYHRTVTTSSPEAQAFFDQGLRLTFAFNHDEAARSFAKAASLDPSCAMCFWGASLTLGPNYNVPMLPDRAAAAWEALQKAKTAATAGTPVEQALIEALANRYGGPEPLEPPAMQPFNESYANAMRAVATKFADDLDAQVLFAEAAMNVNAWKLWTLDGKAAEGTSEIVTTLERVLKKNPKHPGANHYYIHVIEASPTPGKAEAAADRLGGMMPSAGHLVHMPAHIYQRVGRYGDASERNRQAAAADVEYISNAKPFGYYPLYLSHNFGFLAYSASMEGRRAESMTAAAGVVEHTPKEVVCSMPGADFFTAIPYFVMVRFGIWDQLSKEPRPPEKYHILTGLWLHAHGMAMAGLDDLDGAQADLDELRALIGKVPADLMAGLSTAADLLTVGATVLAARVADKRGDPAALELWADAVAKSDVLPYNEPADWFYPIRHYQGASLLAAGKAKEAEAVYREDLRRNPGNGWTLFGLAQSLKAQKKKAAARKVEKQFAAAWKNADIKLTSSAF